MQVLQEVPGCSQVAQLVGHLMQVLELVLPKNVAGQSVMHAGGLTKELENLVEPQFWVQTSGVGSASKK